MYVDDDGFEFGSSKLESYSLASINQIFFFLKNSMGLITCFDIDRLQIKMRFLKPIDDDMCYEFIKKHPDYQQRSELRRRTKSEISHYH